jgi:hypothetical protein
VVLGPDCDRSHRVFLSHRVDQFGHEDYADRDAFAFIADLSQIPHDFGLMIKLLERVGRKKAGALIVSGGSLFFRIDVPLSASPEHLRGSLFLCGSIADELEGILTGADHA